MRSTIISTLRLIGPAVTVHPRDEILPTAEDEPELAWPRISGYAVLSVIGSGGMGVVFKAKHRELQRVVALKMLLPGSFGESESRDRFRAEAEAVARFQHPNIIQVFGVGTIDPLPGEVHPSPFIALEFVDGGSLAEHTKTPRPPQFAARMVEKLARAVNAAHRAGVIHRDLKPANVLLTTDGEPKIADFGLAKRLGAERDSGGRFVTQAGAVMGTPEYMAPEQVAGQPPSPLMDIYALGVILYELLTARVPHQGATPSDTMMMIRFAETVSPRRLQPGLPRDLETICLKALEKTPARRYQTAEALAEDLARWLDGRTILARPIGAVGRTLRWARRNPAVATLSMMVLLVGLIGVSGVVWKWREAKALAVAKEQSANDAKALAVAAEQSENEARQFARMERWERYRAEIIAASSALRLHDVASARRALEAAPKEHRNWEWHHFRSQLEGSTRSLRVNEKGIYGPSISRDNRRVVVINSDNTVHVWDVASGKELVRYGKLEARPHFALSPDGNVMAYVRADYSVEIRSLETDCIIAVLQGHEKPMLGMIFSPDGTRLATNAQDGTLRMWDVATGKPLYVLQGHDKSPGALGFSPDGRRFVSSCGADRTARVWDTATGTLLVVLAGHGQCVQEVGFSPSGAHVTTREPFPNNTVRVWEVATGKPCAVFNGHTNTVTSEVFRPDGKRLVTTSKDQTARLWDLDGNLIAVLKGHKGLVHHAAFSPDGTRLVTASEDKTLRLWDANTGEPLAVLHGHLGGILQVAYSADGTEVISVATDATVRTWNSHQAESGGILRGHTNFVYGVAFHPDGKRVASASWDGTARLWDSTTGRQLQVFPHGEKGIVASVAIHPDGRLLATVSRDNAARLWDLESGKLVHTWPVPTQFWQDTRLKFSPTGDLLAVGGKDGEARLLDVNARTEVAVLGKQRDGIRDVAFSHDGRWLASAGEFFDRTVRIRDVATRAEIGKLEGHTNAVYAVAFSSDGTLIATGSTDGTVRLWDAATFESLAVLNHGTNTYCVAFSPDQTRLAVACADNTIRLWDVKTRQEVAALWGHNEYVHALAFSPDGTRLVSASGDCTVRVWDTHQKVGNSK